MVDFIERGFNDGFTIEEKREHDRRIEEYRRQSAERGGEYASYIDAVKAAGERGQIGEGFSLGNLEGSSEDIYWWLGGAPEAGDTGAPQRTRFIQDMQARGFTDPAEYIRAIRERAEVRRGLSQSQSLRPGADVQTTATANIRNLLT